MNMKKRDFLRGFGMISAGVVAAAGEAKAQITHTPGGG